MKPEGYLVDVPMCVYNHEKFISKAIEGILQQETKFNYRLLIGEDCSTDKTREIVKKYLDDNPKKMQVFFREKNLGAFENSRILFAQCKAKYIALCDGDDYWTDPHKLQKQVDFLEANPTIAGCFHDVIVVDENGNLLKENYYESPLKVYNQRDSITQHGGRYATCSLVFRSLILNDWPEWFSKAISDYAIDILITEYGDIAYINGNMGAYRIHRGGIWQGSKPHKNLEQTVKRYLVFLNEPKFKKNYESHFSGLISDLSHTISIAYRKENQWSKQMKYAWYNFRYAKEKKQDVLKFLIFSLLHPLTMKIKKYGKNIIAKLLKIKRVRLFLLNNLLNWNSLVSPEKFKRNVLAKLRRDIVGDLFSYPSFINNGYLHIERAIEIIKKNAPLDKIILDVGAAGGETCILFSNAFPSCRIYGFEPILETFRILENNTKHVYNIKIYHTALGSSKGDSEINITNRITASSLLQTNEAATFNGNDYFKIVQKEKISIDVLDNFVSSKDQVALLKIDVQGFELEVLKGASNTLKRTSFVLLEMQNHSIYQGAPLYYHLDEYLRSNGFELFEIIPSIRENMQVKEFDALYKSKSVTKW